MNENGYIYKQADKDLSKYPHSSAYPLFKKKYSIVYFTILSE